MPSELTRRIRHTLSAYFDLSTDISQPGTTLVPREWMTGKSWMLLWPVGERTIIEVAPALRDDVQRIVNAYPPEHRLTVADFRRTWGMVEAGGMGFFALDPASFQPVKTAESVIVRPLTPDDAAAFEAFQASCSEAERAEAQIGLDDDVIVGALDGDRIVAAGSTFDWCGFVDLGVLTDPTYRRRGLGAAGVSALCEHYHAASDPRGVVYRHAAANAGSRRLAERIGLAHYALIKEVRRV